MYRPISLRQHQSGFNLLEIMIASVILSIGLLGLAAMQATSGKVTHNASKKQLASFFIDDMLNRMRSNRAAVYTGVYSNMDSIECDGDRPVYCDDTACTARFLAFSDMYEVQCGDGDGENGGGVTEYLPNGRLNVTCNPTDCSGRVRVAVTWDEFDVHPEAAQDVEAMELFVDAEI